MIVLRILLLASVAAALCGCHADHPSPEQVKQVNEFVHQRTTANWDVNELFNERAATPATVAGDLSLRTATELALVHNLSLIASGENLSIAHAQLVQAGLIANPTLGQSSGLLFPFQSHMYPAVDGNITQVLNSIFTQPTRVSIAKFEEVQANIDMATQAYMVAQQVDGKYQEMIQLTRRRELAERIVDLYARAVRAAEARRKVGIITAPELNRARLSYQDARRQVRHLTTQYARAAREMNWLMGDSREPAWQLPRSVIDDVATEFAVPDPTRLEKLARQFRLDLLRAELDNKLGERGEELARLGMIPQITVGAEVARDSQHNVVGGPWLVGITLPIFDPGIVAFEMAKAQARKANKTYAALDGQVGQDVRTALANWQISADDVTFFRESLIPQQEENVRLMETSFRFGNDDLDTLLNVYQNYVSQLQAFEDAIQAYHDSGVNLQQAVGLSWDRIVELANVPRAPRAPATTRAAIFPVTASQPSEPATTESATQPATTEKTP